MPYVDRSRIDGVAATRCRARPIVVPGWGTVGVRIMRGTEQAEFVRAFRAIDENDDAACDAFALRTLARLLVDENGARLFADDETDALDAHGMATIMSTFTAAAEVNAFGEGHKEIARDFPSTQTGCGGSA